MYPLITTLVHTLMLPTRLVNQNSLAAPNTPSVNGLNAALLSNNPNGNYSINPVRLDRSQAITCDMNHEYTAEQQAYHGGLVDKFVEFTGPTDKGCTDMAHKKLVMGYFDGNTATGTLELCTTFCNE